MSGKPLVQSNQIYNNKDSGMVFMQKVGLLKENDIFLLLIPTTSLTCAVWVVSSFSDLISAERR